jgi:nucleotide-binding universal stress UspA family protein
MLGKILVAIDGSDHAEHALQFALDLAEQYSASIELLTVFHPPYLPYPIDSMDIATPQVLEEGLAAQKEYQEQMLMRALDRVKSRKPGLRITARLAEGRPADKIIEHAKNANVDLIVIGSRGLGGIKQLVLGSVSDRVADAAPCPVLVVK